MNKLQKTKIVGFSFAFAWMATSASYAQMLPTQEAKPGVRWRWMGSAVEKEKQQVGIETDMATGTGWPFGGPWVPIKEAVCKAVFVDTIVDIKQKLMDIDFQVPAKERAFAKLKLIKAYPVEGDKSKKRVIALYESRTRQKVKRAAPGGEGYVIDHFDSTAVVHYLAHIDSAFVASKTPYPHTFFNDSYEGVWCQLDSYPANRV